MARKTKTPDTLLGKVERMMKLKAEAGERYKEAAKLFDSIRQELEVDTPVALGNGTSFVYRDQFVDQASGKPTDTLWKKTPVNRYEWEIIAG
jgi:hypothetical protein